MFVITGITGRVGSNVADNLLKAGLPVRAVVRDAEKGKVWKDRGCEVALASIGDADALTKAFAGAKSLFLMTPPDFDPEPGFPDTVANSKAIKKAIEATSLGKVVFLSTVGAHVSEPNLLNNAKINEEMLRTLSVPVALLRAAWFMENSTWEVDAAKVGEIPSFLQPLDHPIPMIATADIGKVASELLQQTWSGTRVIEVEGPCRYSANDIGKAFAQALHRDVRMVPVPRDTWETLFRSQGMKNPIPRMRMVDGFNEGWIDFERSGEHRKATTPLETVIARLVKA